jgi:tight adherence protein C
MDLLARFAANPAVIATLGALAALLALALLLAQAWASRRGQRRAETHLDRAAALRRPDAEASAELEEIGLGAAPAGSVLGQLARWLDQGIGRALVAQEDRDLLDQCGLNLARHRALYLGARLLAPALLLTLALLAPDTMAPSKRMLLWFAAGVVGLLLPKWWLRARAGARCRQAHEETPLLVDLLRLLQGSGMSLDQSLQVVADGFREVLPVLGHELENANRQFAAGRPRQATLQRLGRVYQSEDLANLVALLRQIDRHGGAVQEPLMQFGQRLREKRRAALRELVGKLNVKMTGVMVLTLLPALLIVVAGPGFLAVIRSLGRM